jgi:hypothetical protein
MNPPRGPSAGQAELRSFDGGVRARVKLLRPDRYRHLSEPAGAAHPAATPDAAEP